MTAYLAQAGPAVSNYHRPDLLDQRLDRSRVAPGRPRRQIAETGRLTGLPEVP